MVVVGPGAAAVVPDLLLFLAKHQANVSPDLLHSAASAFAGRASAATEGQCADVICSLVALGGDVQALPLAKLAAPLVATRPSGHAAMAATVRAFVALIGLHSNQARSVSWQL